MCWDCLQKNYKGIKIAKRNIPIIKIVYKFKDPIPEYLSTIYGFKYTLGKKNPIIEELVPKMDIALYGYGNCTTYKSVYSVNRGYHSYFCNNVIIHDDKVIAYLDRVPPRRLIGSEIIIKGIVPKGSKYLKNEYGEIVSDQIILQKEVDLYKYATKDKNILTKVMKRIKWKLSYVF